MSTKVISICEITPYPPLSPIIIRELPKPEFKMPVLDMGLIDNFEVLENEFNNINISSEKAQDLRQIHTRHRLAR